MKRMIAAALALLMLLLPVALGEAGDRITYTDMALETTEDGDVRATDLTGFSLALTAGSPDGVPTMQAELFRKGSRTRRAVLQCIHGVLYFNMDYLTQPLALNLAAVGPSAQSFVEGLFENTASLMDFKLPAFEGVDIPRVNLAPLASMLGGQATTDGDGAETVSFSVPYETTKQLVERLRRYADAAPEAVRESLDSAFRLIDAMAEGDSGFALKGSVTDGKKKSELTLDIYAVRGGVTADEAVATVNASFAKNKVRADVEMRRGGFSMNVAEFALTSKPNKSRLECTLNAMGVLDVAAKLYPLDGAQYASFDAKIMGKKYAAALTYGPKGGGDFMDFSLALPDRLDLSASVDTQRDADGKSVGTFVLNVLRDDGVARYALDGNVAGSTVDTDFYPVRDIGNAISLIGMTDAQREQLARDFKNMSGIVTRYFKRRAG